MKVAVIGAGIVGITTAYELAMDGHQVTVFERRSAAAEEASFANAGIAGGGYAMPWAAPGMPGKVLGQLLSRHAPLRLSLPVSSRELAWMWKWMRACKLEAYLANHAQLQRLAFYSQHRLHLLTDELQLEYERSPGCLVLLRTEKDCELIEPGLQVLREAGVKFSQINAGEVQQIEPSLNPEAEFLGALHLPDDEVANCRQFAVLLKQEAERLGVHFRFNTTVAKIDPAHAATVLVAGEVSWRRFDQVVMCAGLACAELLQPLGFDIPMAAVYGYSVSAPLRDTHNAPRSALMDQHYQVAMARLGNRVRVSGSAEIGGLPERQSEAVLITLYKVLQDWFPGTAQRSGSSGSVQVWKGARPMLPDGRPVIGHSGRPGLWFNFGHGASGWALSCGSARTLADLMAGNIAEIDMQGLGISRLN